MNTIARVFALLVVLTLAAQGEPLSSPPNRIVLPADVVPERYDIRVIPDAEALTFTGQVNIAISVQRAADRIVLNAADLTIGRTTLSGRSETPKVVRNEPQQTAAFVFDTPVAPGHYVLSINYSGKIYQQFSGLFALDYDTPQGQRRALFTQFENSDARRFMPSWDEPACKAVFALTVVAAPGEMAISNMPVANTSTEGDGRIAISFADSPKMSTYLLFVALGDFERISRKVGDTEVGLVVRRGETAKGEFALDAAVGLLGYYNDYFGTQYPLPKLDLVGAPGRSQVFAGMENWGAIRFTEDVLLLDENSTEADKQGVVTMVAHEMAHQWFGNLVTMAWWDDLWLNEGFASWMENKATDHFHPEWKIWLQTAANRDWAMKTDARSGTHPVVTPIRDVLEAATAFDEITYQKGEAVIRMLEAYVGEEAFRMGVRNYIKRYAYENTVTDDLWTEIDNASNLPVTQIAHDFTQHEGVPLIGVEGSPNGMKLSQDRFIADDTPPAAQSWHTPVIVGLGGGNPVWRGIVSAVTPATVTGQLSQPAIVNAGQTGYFRVAYDRALWRPLVARFAELSPDDQLGLLYDSRALGEAGQAPMSDFLELANQIGSGTDPVVSKSVRDVIAAYNFYYEGLPGQPAFRAFGRKCLNPLLVRLGWDPRPGEPDNDALLRTAILTTLGDLDDAAVIAEARRRFADYLTKPDTLSGSTRETVLYIVASNADSATWEQIHDLAKAASKPTDKSRLYNFLGASHDPTLTSKALMLALSDEPPITIRPDIIKSVAAVFPERAFDFTLANRVKLEKLLEFAARYSFFADVAFSARDVATAEKLAAYSEGVPINARSDVTKAIAAIRYRAKVIATRLPEIDHWLAAHGV